MFGDVVNWDLIPPSAIAGIQLIPGSNPVFGLNTLGGALAVTTKSGADYPGASVDASAGSYGRRTLTFEAGGTLGKLDGFVTGNLVNEEGWRDYSPSRIRQLFAKSARMMATPSSPRARCLPTTTSPEPRRCRCRCSTTRGRLIRGPTAPTIGSRS